MSDSSYLATEDDLAAFQKLSNEYEAKPTVSERVPFAALFRRGVPRFLSFGLIEHRAHSSASASPAPLSRPNMPTPILFTR